MNYPIIKDNEYTSKIVDTTMLGDGVAKIHGYTVFIKGALIGEDIKFSPYKLSKKYANANLIEIIKPSKNRQIPFCPHYELCGGCSLQFADYLYQLNIKKTTITSALKRVLSTTLKIDILGMDHPFDYRNKTTFSVDMKDDISIGFKIAKSEIVVDAPLCMIQHKSAMDTLRSVKRFYKKYPNTKVRLLSITSRYSMENNEHMIILKGKKLGHLCQELRNDLSPKSIYTQNIKDEYTLFSGEKYIIERIHGIDYAISPGSFFQINTTQANVIMDIVKGYISKINTKSLIDAYCGAGFFALALSGSIKKVTGIESYKPAVISARNNAKFNGIKNVEFLTGKVEDVILEIIASGDKPDTILVDPPRKGCDKKLIECIIENGIKNIIYVSCNPFTLARDLEQLIDGDYEIMDVLAIDVFPWTSHVETVVRLCFKS